MSNDLRFGRRLTSPTELPDFRLWLIDQWRPGRMFHDIEKLTLMSMLADGWPTDYANPYSPSFDAETLPGAQLYWVSTEMCHVIDLAAKTLLPTTLTPELIPAPEGLIYFEDIMSGMPSSVKPILNRTPEEMEGPVHVRMMMWGTAVIPLTKGTTRCVGISMYAENVDIVAPAGRTDWLMGQDTDEPTEKGVLEFGDEEMRLESMAEDRRRLATFWLLLSQGGVADTTKLRPARSVVRRSQRANVPSLVRVVNVHQPKRSSNESGEGREIEWSHRWIVGGETGGFWRQQAYGPNHSLRRPKFILPFVKGPADKPLIIKDTVHVLKGET